MTINHTARRTLLICAGFFAAASFVSPLAFAQAPAPRALTRGWVFTAQDGKELYQKICQGCHMANGEGAKGAGMYPALANNPRVASSGYIVSNVLNGLRGMPGLGIYLSDAQVAAVATYVRTNMGNKYTEPISLEEVKALRKPAKGVFDE